MAADLRRGGAQTNLATNSGALTTETAVATVTTGPGETSLDLTVGGGPLNAAVVALAAIALANGAARAGADAQAWLAPARRCTATGPSTSSA